MQHIPVSGIQHSKESRAVLHVVNRYHVKRKQEGKPKCVYEHEVPLGGVSSIMLISQKPTGKIEGEVA